MHRVLQGVNLKENYILDFKIKLFETVGRFEGTKVSFCKNNKM